MAGSSRQSNGGRIIRPTAAAGTCTTSAANGMNALVAMKFSLPILSTLEKLRNVIAVNSAPPTRIASTIVGGCMRSAVAGNSSVRGNRLWCTASISAPTVTRPAAAVTSVTSAVTRIFSARFAAARFHLWNSLAKARAPTARPQATALASTGTNRA